MKKLHVREKNALVYAIESEQWDKALRLASPELVNTYDENGWTPLIRAARYIAPEEVLIKIIENASEECVKHKDHGGRTILHRFSLFSPPSALRRVLAVNADNVNAQDYVNGWTPLHECLIVDRRSFEEQRETAKILMEFGAMPTIKENKGRTPIDLYKRNPCSGYDENLKDEQKKELLKILEETAAREKIAEQTTEMLSTRLQSSKTVESMEEESAEIESVLVPRKPLIKSPSATRIMTGKSAREKVAEQTTEMLSTRLQSSKTVESMEEEAEIESASKYFDFIGGILILNDIRLVITQNAIKKKIRIGMVTIENEEIPNLETTETLLSPVVHCFPTGTVFNQRCLLSIPHNIVDKKIWKLSGLVQDKPGGTWRKIKNDDKDYRCYIRNGRCFIELQHFTRFGLLGKLCVRVQGKADVKPVHMIVLEDWHENLPNTYALCVATWRRESDKPMDANAKIYTYPLTSKHMTVRVEDTSDRWTVEPNEQFVHKRLVWNQYRCTFNLKAEAGTQMANPPSCNIRLIQDGVKQEPRVQIPQHYWKYQGAEKLSQNPKQTFPENQSEIERRLKPEELRLRGLLTELSEQYDGSYCHWLRCLLFDQLSIADLSNAGDSAMALFNKLEIRGHISCSNVIILLEVAKLTKIKSAISCITEYNRANHCDEEGTVLTNYRKTLFSALTQVPHDELPRLIDQYRLDSYRNAFRDVWDVVYYLERQKLLDETPDKMERFAGLLNAIARDVLLKGITSSTTNEATDSLITKEATDSLITKEATDSSTVVTTNEATDGSTDVTTKEATDSSTNGSKVATGEVEAKEVPVKAEAIVNTDATSEKEEEEAKEEKTAVKNEEVDKQKKQPKATKVKKILGMDEAKAMRVVILVLSIAVAVLTIIVMATTGGGTSTN